MDEGMLSQEEINALLNGDEKSKDITENKVMNEQEKDAIGEISNICMGTAATTLSTLVNQKVIITTPVVSTITMEELSARFERPCVFIQISYIEGLDGSNVLILAEDDVKVITDLMMGGDGSNIAEELTELHLSAISEAMNQMMGSASTSLSSLLERKIDISPPTADLIDLNDSVANNTYSYLTGVFAMVSFKMEIGDLVDSQIMQLYPFDFARELYDKFAGGDTVEESQNTGTVGSTTMQQQPAQQVEMTQPQMDQTMVSQSQPIMGQPMQGQPMMGQPMQGQPIMGQPMQGQPMMGQSMQGQPVYMMPPQDVNIQTAQFQAFNQGVNPLMQQENMDLIMDVPLEVTVELGRTNKTIKEIIGFSPGTIIELEKLAGEPIDVLVNGKYVAKGEVVVIEENFGIRVTEIIK